MKKHPTLFEALSFHTFLVTWTATKPLVLQPAWFARIRGAVGQALMAADCKGADVKKPEPCAACHCMYGKWFVAQTGDGGFVPKYVIQPAGVQKNKVQRGDSVSVYVHLFGATAHDLLLWKRALGIAHQYGFMSTLFFPAQLYLVDPDTEEPKPFVNRREPPAAFTHKHIEKRVMEEENTRAIQLRWLTPVKLYKNDHIVAHPTYALLLERIAKRLAALAEVPWTGGLTVNGDTYLDTTYSTDTYNLRHKAYDMNGALGSQVFYTTASPEEQMLLHWGQFCGVGRFANMGAGCYRLEKPAFTGYYKWLEETDWNTLIPEVDKKEDVTPALWADCLEKLTAHNYVPTPYKKVSIPKDQGEKRVLNIPAAIDKVLQHAVVDFVGSGIEENFLPQSYAYRPGKGHVKAIRYAYHLWQNEARDHVVVRCDIDNFFDTVPLGPLAERFFRFCKDAGLSRLVWLWLHNGIADKEKPSGYAPNLRGLAQGNVISPLLANFYLHPLDVYIDKNLTPYFVRYADDLLLFFPSLKTAKEGIQKLKSFLHYRLDLELNKDIKTRTDQLPFTFLGITFSEGSLQISPKKITKLANEMAYWARYTQAGWHPKLLEKADGIRRYYARLVSHDDLEDLDEALLTAYGLRLRERRKGKWKNLAKGEVRKRVNGLPLFANYSQTERNALYGQLYNKVVYGGKQPLAAPGSPKRLLKKQKKQVERTASKHFELVVARPGVYLGISKNRIQVRLGRKVVHSQPIGPLEHISIMTKGVSLSSNLTFFCSKHEVPITFYDYRGRPYSMLHTPEHLHAETIQAQDAALDDGRAQYIAAAITANKIKNQLKLLKHLGKSRKEEAFFEGFEAIENEMNALHKKAKALGRQTETNQEQLMLLEAHAAKYYWQRLGRLFSEKELFFPGRKRKGATDLVNSMLNYGYAILYSRVWQAILFAGLQPTISYLHTPKGDKPTLVFDLMEQYRSFVVDRSVISQINKGEPTGLNDNGLLDKPTRERLVERIVERLNARERWGKERFTVRELMKRQANHYADYLEKKEKRLTFYKPKW